MTDLYAILGVAKTASKAAIKKAFRALAKKHHPDAGGDPARFDEISKAHTILTDDVKRARYDETGDTKEPEDTITPRAINMLIAVFGSIMNEPDVLTRDPLPFMRSAMADMKKDAVSVSEHTRKQMDHLIKVKARFTMKSDAGPDVIGGFIDQNLASLEQKMAVMNDQLVVSDKAISMIDAYTFTPEKEVKSKTVDPGASIKKEFFDSVLEAALKSGSFDPGMFKKAGKFGL